MDRRLTLPEASAWSRIPEPTLRWYRHLGIGPRSYRLGRRVYYDLADLESWVEQQKQADGEARGA